VKVRVKAVLAGGAWGRLFRQKPAGKTLASELRALESRAREACVAAGIAYSRTILAGQSGVSRETLSTWIDGQRTPQDGDNLMQVVTVLTRLSGQAAPDEPGWRELWAAARRDRGPGTKAAADKKLRPLVMWVAGVVTTVLLGGIFAPITSNGRGILWNALFPDPSPAPKNTLEDFKATAAWCCRFTMVSENGGFYWNGSASSLDSALSGMRGETSISSLTPAGSGVVEILLQTSGTEPIYVAPPKVIVRSRGQNVKSGMVALLPLYPQGSSAPGEFSADVDEPSPVTIASGSSGNQYYYVSNTSPETFILTVEDASYDCKFDIELTWMEQGKLQSRVLNNSGHHFRILGSSELPWYSGNPGMNEKLTRVGGRPFSSYISSNLAEGCI
jgi:hypothetical protein